MKKNKTDLYDVVMSSSFIFDLNGKIVVFDKLVESELIKCGSLMFSDCRVGVVGEYKRDNKIFTFIDSFEFGMFSIDGSIERVNICDKGCCCLSVLSNNEYGVKKSYVVPLLKNSKNISYKINKMFKCSESINSPFMNCVSDDGSVGICSLKSTNIDLISIN